MKKENRSKRYMIFLLLLCLVWNMRSGSVFAAEWGNYDCKNDLHQYEVELVTPSGKDTEGLRRYVCRLCGDSYEESVPRYGHTWSDWVVESRATCSKEGLAYRYCVECDQEGVREERALPKVEHEYGDWRVKKAATVKENGLKTQDCIYGCGETKTKTIPKRTKDLYEDAVEAEEVPGKQQKGSYHLDAVLVGGGALILLIYGGVILSNLMVLLWYRKIKQEAKMRWWEDLAESAI